MESAVKQRLIQFLESQRISKTEFGRMIGVSNAYVMAIKENIPTDKLARIKQVFPDLNISWLLTGEGNMIAERPAPQTAPTPHDNITHLLTIIDRLTRVNEQQADTIARLTRAGEVAKVITPPPLYS